MTTPLLAINDLSIAFRQGDALRPVVEDLSLRINAGETLALVGESGSGKSVTSLALMRLIEQAGGQVSGEALLRRRNGEVLDLMRASKQQMRRVRGADMAMIFQEPMTSLNPVFSVGEQIAESIRLHQGQSHAAALAEARRMLDLVRIPDAQNVLSRFPHQLSGGMRQRVMIAMALCCKPALLIADEPTTALDVTIQAQILQLIRVLQKEMQMGVIFITHDMGVVAEMADRVQVMYRGEVVEKAPVDRLFSAPEQPYTQALLAAVPKLGAMQGQPLPAKFPLLHSDAADDVPQDTVRRLQPPILQVRDLVTRFDIRGGLLNRVKSRVHAVEKVSFDLYAGETLALVGESGCGKSTTGRSLLRLVASQGGTLTFDGQRIDTLSGAALAHLRRDIQFIFQDPYASLDPRLTVGFSIMEPLLVHKVMPRREAEQRVAWLLDKVGLLPEHAQRYPHEFSGGQRQRVGIARALAVNPEFVICDEPISALDVSIQAQVINLLKELQEKRGLTYLFIAHDLSMVKHISDRIGVMYLGAMVELADSESLFEAPLHPYTQALLSAIPVPDPDVEKSRSRIMLEGSLPNPVNLKEGCRFASRCPYAEQLCKEKTPEMKEVRPGHFAACHKAM